MKQNKNNLFGILGSILGAFVGALPWLLAYALGNVIIGLLSIFIAIGSYMGYKITKNEINKNFSKLVFFSTILTVTISFLVIMPIIRQAVNGFNISFEWIPNTLKNWNLLSAFLFDYIVSIGIALIGAIAVITTVTKKQQETNETGDINPSQLFSYQSVSPEEIQKIKDAFGNKNAMSKENAVQREEIISELSKTMIEARAIQVFNLIKDQQIIRKYKGKFYFSERAQNDQLYRNAKLLTITLIASTFVIAIIVIFTIIGNNKKLQDNGTNSKTETIVEIRENSHIIKNTNIKFTPKDDLQLLTKSEKEKYKNVIEYDFIAMNEKHTKMLYCFIDYGLNIEGNLTAREYLEQAFNENVRTEITSVTMANSEFQKTNLNLEEAGDLYTVECYITKINDKFLCFNYWYPKNEQSNLNEMLETMETNQ